MLKRKSGEQPNQHRLQQAAVLSKKRPLEDVNLFAPDFEIPISK